MVCTVEKGSEKGSQKGFWEGGVSRRCLERPVGEHDPLGVRPFFFNFDRNIFPHLSLSRNSQETRRYS